jgi:hypothetical protein
MPFEITFNAKVIARDEEQYFNDCCWGGDVIQEQLLPVIEGRYSDIQANQEDWGWFIWMSTSKLNLAIDIFCDDKNKGKFRVRISAKKK